MTATLRLALVATLLLAPAPHPADTPTPPARPVPGARGVAITVLTGDQLEEIPVRFLGTYDNFAGPGNDLHLVQLEGPEAERIGVAAGMSGSPVYFEGRLLGALAYRLGALPIDPVAGVTPIEDMVRNPSERGHASTPDSSIRPIATPISVSGAAPGTLSWLAPQLEAHGFRVMGSGGGDDAGASPPLPLRPGSPVGAELVRGDMRIAATGTVTWVDGDTVYAFGHPFLGSGPVEMPMVSARVIHTLADLAGSVKLSSVGPEIGAIVEDRLSTIVGHSGGRARMIPVTLDLRGGDYGEQRFQFEVARSLELAPLLVGAAVANTLQSNNGYVAQSTLLASGEVRLRDLPALPIEFASSAAAGLDPSLSLASQILVTLGSLWRNPFTEIEVEGITLSIAARKDVVSYRVDSVSYDRGELRPGQTLSLRCSLKKYRGGTTIRELSIRLPEHLPKGKQLVVALSNPEGIDQTLGGPLGQRAASATEARALVEALADRGSANRLTAVVYEPQSTIVSRGVAYHDLPPTAERLLGLQTAKADRRRAPIVSPLARAELALDGPVEGVVQVPLRVERSGGSAEDPR